MLAAGRIVVDVLVYRLRRLEMANLVAAAALLIALKVPLADAALRFAFALVLNVLAYLINDHIDVEQDLAQGRAVEKTRFLHENRRASVAAQLGLVALLAATGVVAERPSLVISLVGGAGLCWVYTLWLKRVPLLDVLAMTVWGVTMPLAAVPIESYVGWFLLGQLGLFSTCFEAIQVLRDREQDAADAVRTTAVALGAARTVWLVRMAMVLCTGYAVLFVHRWVGLGLLLALALPVTATAGASQFAKYWNRVRLVFGSVVASRPCPCVVGGRATWLAKSLNREHRDSNAGRAQPRGRHSSLPGGQTR